MKKTSQLRNEIKQKKKDVRFVYLSYECNRGHTYNHGLNNLRIFDVLPSFPFTANETKPDY